MVSIVFLILLLLAQSVFLTPVVFSLLYSVPGGDDQIASKSLSNFVYIVPLMFAFFKFYNMTRKKRIHG